MTNIMFVGAKGGVGTSTIAASTALELARAGVKVNLASRTLDELAAILGMPTPAGDGEKVTEGFTLTTNVEGGTGYTTVVDGGTTMPDQYDGEVVLVTTNCYLALRRALAMPRPDRIVLILDDERSLKQADVEDVLGMPVTVVERSAEISRSIDAGLLAVRMPKILRRALATQ